MMDDEPLYNEWIEDRRSDRPAHDFADRVMASLNKQMPLRQRTPISDRLNKSLLARWAACLSAMIVGSLPFVYAAYAAKLIAP